MFASVGALSSAVAFGSAPPPSLALVVAPLFVFTLASALPPSLAPVGAPPPIASAVISHLPSLRLSIAGHVISLLFIIMPAHRRLRHFAAFHRCARPFSLWNG